MAGDPAGAVRSLWAFARLPPTSLSQLSFTSTSTTEPALPSSFHVTALAQSTIGASALAAAQLFALRSSSALPRISVDAANAAAEFRSEQLTTLDGKVGNVWDEPVGVYEAKEGWCRPHTNWPHHKAGLLDMLGLNEGAKREELAEAFKTVNAVEFADRAMEKGLVITGRRTDLHPQGQAAAARIGGPVVMTKVASRPPKLLPPLSTKRPLQGIRVLDLTRVIAGPTAGRTLATYGAEVLWITAPHLPTLPGLDFSTSLGKRAIQLDLRPTSPDSIAKFRQLLSTADVLLQAYRPGALSSLGFSEKEIRQINPDIVVANLSAWGADGPWRERKGFDSLIQFGTGIGAAEADEWKEFSGESLPLRALPCQALDHASAFLLAFGIQAALYHRSLTGGSFVVSNSLLDTATFLRTFGRATPITFERGLETRNELRMRGGMNKISGFEGKEVEYLRHAARFEEMGEKDVGLRSAPGGYCDGKADWQGCGS
ncbi:hypothetical protein P7C70_g2109, partial [Phenoliferia sp. Uapishka_3]